MKQHLIFLLVFFLSVPAFAQTETENYIISTKYNTPIQEQYLHYVPDELKRVNITYLDGLGRAKQTIALGAGEDWQDIVVPIVYDSYGRQAKTYLPYADKNQYEPSLDYRDNTTTISSIKALYDARHPEAFSSGTINPYSETAYDNSPLNRAVKQGYPGQNGDVNLQGVNNHTVRTEHLVNTGLDVYNFNAVYTDPADTETPTLIVSGYYGSGQLYKTVVKNENWTSGTNNTTQEFKDKNGNVLLKRAYNYISASSPSSSTAYNTYYVYDRFDNLTFVIPPLAADQIVQSQNQINSDVLNGLCYIYHYDYRNRVIEKKVPGKGWEYIVYDKLDRPVLTQDQNLKDENKWLFTKYDIFGRVVYTGEYTDSRTRKAIQEDLDDNVTLLLSETRTTGSFTNSGAVVHYTNSAFPTTNLSLLTISYYDDYNFDRVGIPVYTANEFGTAIKSNPKGLSTGSKVRILGEQVWATSLAFYDDKGRVLKSHEKNVFLSSELIKDIDQDYVGNVLSEKTTHKKLNLPDLTIYDEYIYDQRDRLVGHYQSQTPQNQAGSNPHIININHYDELGQLVKKEVGGRINLPTTLQRVDFKYNIRGWLTDINNVDQSLTTSTDKDVFAFRINYDNTTLSGSTALYNGNISETHWKSRFDNRKRSYQYTYDYLNRLTNAAYRNYGYTIPSTSYTENYTEGPITYDKNGNILGLSRFGLDENATPSLQKIVKTDGLLYTYDAYSNTLDKVDDTTSLPEGFKDGTNTGNDYRYDTNGNMISDKNKNIANIVYNYLNLPTEIVFENNDRILFVYDALGNKLIKFVKQHNLSTTTDITEYDGDFIYYRSVGSAPAVLQSYFHSEGYVNVPAPSGSAYNPNNFEYIYQYKDHLGNVRLSYKDGNNDGTIALTELVEENHYYAFGLKHKGYNTNVSLSGVAQKYKYNGIEFEDALGYNMYEMGLRKYDPAIARWVTLDPVIHHSLSPYNAFDNNPVFWADPSGADAEQLGPNSYEFTGVDAAAAYIAILGMLDSGEDAVIEVQGSITYTDPYANENASQGGGGDGETDSMDSSKAESKSTNSAAYPDPKTFKFRTIKGSGKGWQESAVVGMYFNVSLVTIGPGGVEIGNPSTIIFPQAISFTVPTNLKIGDTNITSEVAAQATANVVNRVMAKTAKLFAGTPATTMQVEQYFRAELKREYQMSIPGARVNFNSMNHSVTPTVFRHQ